MSLMYDLYFKQLMIKERKSEERPMVLLKITTNTYSTYTLNMFHSPLIYPQTVYTMLMTFLKKLEQVHLELYIDAEKGKLATYLRPNLYLYHI